VRPRLGHAQISADSLSLAQAVAAEIGEMYRNGEQKGKPVLLMSAETSFDSAVNLALRESGFGAVVRDSAHLTRIGTRGMIVVREMADLSRIAGRV
jgi:hypothetical protein